MKLNLEFEIDDFKEMITDYFKTRGFKIRHIDEIVSKFMSAYPEGLIVEASPLNGEADTGSEEVPFEETVPEEISENKKDSKSTLTYEQLMDPEEVVREENEIEKLLKQSDKIIQEKGSEND